MNSNENTNEAQSQSNPGNGENVSTKTEQQMVTPKQAALTKLPSNVQWIPLDKLHESPFNPRKRYGNLDEIAQSMRTHGVLQPLTVRSNKRKGEFEIVFGHRRFRAAKIAKLDAIPVLVRDMDDREAEETQLIENIQRVDVHPMEEAEALDRLIKSGHDVEKLAEQIGKSRGHIYGRLKVLDLDASVRKMFVEDRFGYAIALLLARCSKEVQKKAADKIVEPFKGAEPLSFRQAVQLLRNEFHVGLTEEYNPEEEKKRADAWAAAVEKARADKRRVLTEKELREVFPYGTEAIPADSAFVRIDMQAVGDGKSRNWKSVLGKNIEGLSLVLAHDPLMGIHFLVDVKEANKLAKSLDLFEQKQDGKKGGAATQTAKGKAAAAEPEEEEPDSEAKKAEREEKRLRLRKATADAVLSDLVATIAARKKFDRKYLRLIAAHMLVEFGMPPASLRRREVKSTAEIDISKMDEGELHALIFESLTGNKILSVKDGYGEEIKQFAIEFGVDLKLTEDTIREGEKLAEKAERDAAREKERAKEAAEKEKAEKAEAKKAEKAEAKSGK